MTKNSSSDIHVWMHRCLINCYLCLDEKLLRERARVDAKLENGPNATFERTSDRAFDAILTCCITLHVFQPLRSRSNERLTSVTGPLWESVTVTCHFLKRPHCRISHLRPLLLCKENEDFAICQSLRTIYAETRAQLGTVVHECLANKIELEEKKTKMREKWDAIKKACAVFKETLQLHIRLDTIEEEEFIRISFFVNLNIAMDEYTHYVDLVHSNNFWKVKKIEPNLELEHEEELIKVVDFKKQLNTVHVTMLLYKQLLLLNLGLETVNHSVDKLLRSYVQVSALSLYGTYHM
ncbi:uncharacterized protein LOC107266195 isoform X2 [Cephus cinctus]|uniref:Uncharacterized protein LOC107266195 isoform X2 n=1 Tax=Cephus cinctus TaxID=211228 RepID=A0AAJ7REX4_CEPCN|nr:uncharacterized protein LOC107266195 isoform X2 [Cephus cinctus]